MTTTSASDELLFGWDPMPGIVSVWADREGNALVWQRAGERVTCTRERFRPWLLAASLRDLAQLGDGLVAEGTPGAERALATFRELEGPAETYRFLISARSGRALERAVLDSAARRLQRKVASLYELEDYHRVGPVEQYLMLTGRVYFRGLTHADLHRMQIDLETTALDPQRGRIFMVAVRDSRGLARVLEAPTAADEPRLIAELCALVRERDPDVIEGHNIFDFDLPFLETRAAALRVPLQLARQPGPVRMERYEDPMRSRAGRRRMRYSIAGRELIDTLDAVRRHDFVARDLPSHRLKDVARHFGVAAPERTYVAGAEIYQTYCREPETVRRYALDDVTEVDALAQRLLGAPFALAGMAPRRYERVASAGPAMGILEPLLVRAYVRAGAGLPRQTAAGTADAEPHAGGALHLFATGVAQHVVKADIASLYPSLMRAFHIGPASDRLGALLGIVERLTDLRLEHKAAARTAAPGSLAGSHHQAMQAAMKLIINSAYGYMGAGNMALFADRRAADEVTRRGREILGQVVGELEARGVVLIEADTDGVFFAVPAGWSEARERALVAEVGATLPRGITLEYEGRYRAMLSHEVKNYALLTYDGVLILRGVALRSSRSEPFCERFLYQALRCVLTGDMAGLYRTYRETVAAIRGRKLPVADMATRARLSKTPAAYLDSRAAHREASYEALLAAGRTDWAPGERVRYYRAADGRHVWLPDSDHDDEPPMSASESTGDEAEIVASVDMLAAGEAAASASSATAMIGAGVKSAGAADRRDYHVDHYLNVLVTSYASRLRKAFAPEDFDQLFRPDAQIGLFDRPIDTIEPRWIRCPGD